MKQRYDDHFFVPRSVDLLAGMAGIKEARQDWRQREQIRLRLEF